MVGRELLPESNYVFVEAIVATELRFFRSGFQGNKPMCVYNATQPKIIVNESTAGISRIIRSSSTNLSVELLDSKYLSELFCVHPP